MLNLIPKIKNTDSGNFLLICGPCVVENEDICLEIGETMQNICNNLEIPFVFKASYKKANRTSINSFKGLGDKHGLDILKKIGKELQLPIITDVHEVQEVNLAAKSVDILQIPAYLCRQTELLIAAGQTGKFVNVKKGQFMSANSIGFSLEKIRSTGNMNVMVTERGSMFGMEDLVVDFRGIPIMKSFGAPVIFDVTHSLQKPNQSTGITGGTPEFAETMAKAAVAAGVDGLFIETHPKPSKALSDGTTSIPLKKMQGLLEKLVRLRKAL
ncbi:MAG: 3-deoxy-8-phosphooctulonate synthase [Bacteroidetes bacterium]|nr:3-deoxy-8-phosphooctulonate synthase [Bacteroidota bacterium]MBL0078875.1 3-deoxy-8-phosphooctulonate synthase [Bacteroidota bacterium]